MRDALEERQHVRVTQTNAAMGQRLAHGFRIRRAMQIDVAAEGIDLTHTVAPGLETA